MLGDLDPVTLKYQPSEFPAFNALMVYSQLGHSSPNADELATGAILAELAWSNEDVQSESEGKGLTVLPSMNSGGEYYIMCSLKNAGVELDGWHGRSIRAGSTMNELVVKAAGATPVSMEYGETFEGLQRNVLGCAFIQFAAASSFSVPEVAPNISYLTEGSFAGRASSIVLAGPSFNDLPLRLPADHLRCGAPPVVGLAVQHRRFQGEGNGGGRRTGTTGTPSISCRSRRLSTRTSSCRTGRSECGGASLHHPPGHDCTYPGG